MVYGYPPLPGAVTGEAVSVELRAARLGSRTVALAIDFAVQFALLFVLELVAAQVAIGIDTDLASTPRAGRRAGHRLRLPDRDRDAVARADPGQGSDGHPRGQGRRRAGVVHRDLLPRAGRLPDREARHHLRHPAHGADHQLRAGQAAGRHGGGHGRHLHPDPWHRPRPRGHAAPARRLGCQR